MPMLVFITEHILEIVFGLISAGALAFGKYAFSQMKNYKQLLEEKQNEEAEEYLDSRLEPILKEIEEIRSHIIKDENIYQKNLDLIVSSYRFRLICLCKEYIRKGFLTQDQYDQLSEFYKTYQGLGGNGQAQEYYELVQKLSIHDD